MCHNCTKWIILWTKTPTSRLPNMMRFPWKRHDISGSGLPVATQLICASVPALWVTDESILSNLMSSAEIQQATSVNSRVLQTRHIRLFVDKYGRQHVDVNWTFTFCLPLRLFCLSNAVTDRIIQINTTCFQRQKTKTSKVQSVLANQNPFNFFKRAQYYSTLMPSNIPVWIISVSKWSEWNTVKIEGACCTQCLSIRLRRTQIVAHVWLQYVSDV